LNGKLISNDELERIGSNAWTVVPEFVGKGEGKPGENVRYKLF
jgi:hypothetical protein